MPRPARQLEPSAGSRAARDGRMMRRKCGHGLGFRSNLRLECGRMAEGLSIEWACTAIFLRLGHMALIDPDEGRNTTVASEMMRSGSWLVPTYNGLDYLDKPA